MNTTAPATRITVKETPRSRKLLTIFEIDPTIEREGSWYWLYWNNGQHRVGLFPRSEVETMLVAHSAAGHIISGLEG